MLLLGTRVHDLRMKSEFFFLQYSLYLLYTEIWIFSCAELSRIEFIHNSYFFFFKRLIFKSILKIHNTDRNVRKQSQVLYNSASSNRFANHRIIELKIIIIYSCQRYVLYFFFFNALLFDIYIYTKFSPCFFFFF